MDQSTVYVNGRWIGFASVFLLYLLRVLYLQAFHIITYGLGIYLLNNFIGFLSPAVSALVVFFSYFLTNIVRSILRLKDQYCHLPLVKSFDLLVAAFQSLSFGKQQQQ